MRLLALMLAGLVMLPAWGQALHITDDTGRELRLDGPARRIVSIAPHVTELLFAAGAGDRIVGVDEYSDYPAAARSLPRIGRHSGLDLEAIAALKPDLVIGWASGNRMPQLQGLERLGIPLYLNEIRSIDDIATSMETFGHITASAAAGPAAAALRERIAGLSAHEQAGPRLRVFYQIWHRPLMTINGEHLISQAVSLCGGRNVFAALGTLAPAIGIESVLLADPEVIIASGSAADSPSWLQDWRRWPQLAAVRNDRLVAIPPDIVQRPTPRFLDGVEAICAALKQARQERSGD
ncbi:MAG: cobalamin-binding protein [Zoogloeaceae bacterium]|nr:cobalamin-binding protein [Zoogloeaceae bacterium]